MPVQRLVLASTILVLAWASEAVGEDAQSVDMLFYQEWMTHWPLKSLADALSSNRELAEDPRVDDQSVVECYKPVLDAFTRSMGAYFGPGNNEPATDPEHVAKFMEAHGQWCDAVRGFVAFARSLPIAINLAVSGDTAAYASTPTPPLLYAHVPYQTLVVTLSGNEPDALPRYREETVDLNLYRTIPIRTDGHTPEIIRLGVTNLPEGTRSYPVTVMDPQGRTLAELPLEITGRPSGTLKVRILDEGSGKTTPARVGIYGKTGFLRAGNAIPLYVHEKEEYERGLYDPMWPSEDKRVFFSEGQFEMGMPPGEYRLLVRKGIERLLHEQTFVVEAGKVLSLTVPLIRWIDMPGKGWYSGDDHVHIRRNGENNVPILRFAQAEDVHVSNVVQMDDINTLSFLQYAWGDQGMYAEGDYVLRSGQEGPRTGFRGHALFFNLAHSIHDHNSYYIYENVFEQAHRTGALAGYAHHGVAFGAERGMSLDVPLNMVDFLEVMENYGMNTDVLHHFWNMGFRLVPTAGSDFPYNPTIGDVLVYVYLENPFSFDKWFEGLKHGRTFVTSGPMLEFTVNGQPPGSEIALDGPGRVTIHAAAKVNPTLDTLASLEILQSGQPVQVVTANDAADGRFVLDFDLDVAKSTWIAARAFGGKTRAHTAAVFIPVGGVPTWNPDTLAAELARVEKNLQEIESGMTGPAADDILRANASELSHYIKSAREKYSSLRNQAGLIDAPAPR